MSLKILTRVTPTTVVLIPNINNDPSTVLPGLNTMLIGVLNNQIKTRRIFPFKFIRACVEFAEVIPVMC
jgi:hypothetical protein